MVTGKTPRVMVMGKRIPDLGAWGAGSHSVNLAVITT
jgi:hypothetical protein